MRGEQPIFDADMHVQEPPGVWVEFLDPSLRDRVVVGTREQALPIADGRPLIDLPTPPENRREMRPTLMEDRFGDMARRGFDAPALLEGMDVEGVDVAALFPSYGLYVPWADHLAPELAVGLARSYNRWIVSLCADGDRRLVPVALAPLHDPLATAAEIRRAVVAAAGADRFGTWCGRHAASHPMEQMLALAGLIFDGVFARHPRLRVGVFESGTGWLRWWLHRLDEHWEFLGPEVPQAKLPPSEYVARQCVISTETDDPFVGETVAALGADHVVWASDFPHPEAPWPHAVDGFLERGLSQPDEAAVLWSTPCALYQLDPALLGRGRSLPREPSASALR